MLPDSTQSLASRSAGCLTCISPRSVDAGGRISVPAIKAMDMDQEQERGGRAFPRLPVQHVQRCTRHSSLFHAMGCSALPRASTPVRGPRDECGWPWQDFLAVEISYLRGGWWHGVLARGTNPLSAFGGCRPLKATSPLVIYGL